MQKTLGVFRFQFIKYFRNHFLGVGDGLPFEDGFLLFASAFFDFGLVPEAGFVAVGDGEGAVLGAFGDDAFGPDAVGEVGPVVVAAFELLPGGFEDFLPGLVAEVLPQRGGGDLHAVVEVGLPEFGDLFEGGLEGAQLAELGAEGLQFAVVLRAAVGAVGEGVALGFDLLRLLQSIDVNFRRHAPDRLATAFHTIGHPENNRPAPSIRHANRHFGDQLDHVVQAALPLLEIQILPFEFVGGDGVELIQQIKDVGFVSHGFSVSSTALMTNRGLLDETISQ